MLGRYFHCLIVATVKRRDFRNVPVILESVYVNADFSELSICLVGEDVGYWIQQITTTEKDI